MYKELSPGIIRYLGENGKEEFLQALRDNSVRVVKMDTQGRPTTDGLRIAIYVTAMTRELDAVLEYVEWVELNSREVYYIKRLLEHDLYSEGFLVQEGRWNRNDIIPKEVLERLRDRRLGTTKKSSPTPQPVRSTEGEPPS